MSDNAAVLTPTDIYKLLQSVVLGHTIYDAADTAGLDRDALEHSLNNIELRVLILYIARLRNGADELLRGEAECQ